jgi:hypothetical protein
MRIYNFVIGRDVICFMFLDAPRVVGSMGGGDISDEVVYQFLISVHFTKHSSKICCEYSQLRFYIWNNGCETCKANFANGPFAL